MGNTTKIHFLGASGTVTGSKYLIETRGKKILIDCGLFQGLKELRLRNWEKLPVDASTIDFVLLTHGHLDHVGYLPLLVKQGFKGKVYASGPTVGIAKLILLDSAKIQEEDAKRANRYQYSKHVPAKPLYDTDDAEAVFPLFCSKPLSEWISIDSDVSFRFRYNGHIIGACFIELKIKDKLFVFSGDIGREEDPLLYIPEKPEAADYLFIESTYGNRIHPRNVQQMLADEVNKAYHRGGTIIIPSFAVERSQLLMHLISELKIEKKIPAIPVYMDSPMGKHVLEVFFNNPAWHKLSQRDLDHLSRDIRIVRDPRETEKLLHDKSPKIIIASSGMATGGRVLSYFEHYLGDPDSTILLAGYQGEGTRGRALLDGAREIKMRGKYWDVRATVSQIEGLSAHADQSELLGWISELKNTPSHVFVVHGEKESSTVLAEKIKSIYHYNAIRPCHNQVIIV